MRVSSAAAVRHQLGGHPRHLGEREAGDHHGAGEILPRGVGVAALQLRLVGEGDGVHDEVEAAPGHAQRIENRLQRCAVLHVAGIEQRGAERGGERLHAPAEMLALIGEGELRALRGERLGDAPGDRMIVGDAHDQAALAGHQAVHAVMFLNRRSAATPGWRWCRRIRTSWIARNSSSRAVAPLAHDRHVLEIRVELLDVGALADEAVLHHQQAVDRLLHAGRAERVAGQRLRRRDRRAFLARPEDRRGSPRSPCASPIGVEVACGLM